MTAPHPARRRARVEWWHCAVAFFLGLQVVFAAVPRLRPGKLGMVCWYLGCDPILWWGIAVLIFVPAVLWCVWKRPAWRWSRVVGFGLIGLLAASPLTYRVYPSGNADRISKVRFRVPFDGPVTIGWGGNTPDVNYHVSVPDQRWAYDILIQDRDGRTFRGEGKRLEDYYVYGTPVLAPAAGKVVEMVDGDPEMPIGELGGGSNPGGNHVRIEVAPGELIELAHLKPGSIKVKVGDTVAAGQEVARAGNSGNTSEPHLHVHLQDDWGEGLPLYFYGYRSSGRVVERGIPRGGIEIVGDEVRLAGETVEHVGSGGGAGSGEAGEG